MTSEQVTGLPVCSRRRGFGYNSAPIEELVFDATQGRDKNQLLSLATCEYIKQGASVLVTGLARVGKSFIASALGYQACIAGYKVGYANIQKLLEGMHMARIESMAATSSLTRCVYSGVNVPSVAF